MEINRSQEINGKVLKHICGQGPVNLRCVRAVDTEFAWIDADDESDTDDGETVVIESESEKLPTCLLRTPENSEAENNPRVSVRSKCINSRPNTSINNSNSSIPDSAIEGQGDTLYLAVPCNQTVINF